jgi:hypothetical protein
MMSRLSPSRRGVLSLLGGAMLLGSPGLARAQDSHKAECAAAYESSQELRANGKLRKASEALAICAEDTCPAFVRTDCVQWLGEVKHDLPTVTVSAKDQHGEDVTKVRVLVDGDLLVEELDGKSVAIDPGSHKLRFELEGAAPIEQQIVIKQGEKDRAIDVSFAPKGADVPEDNPYAGTEKDKPAADADSSAEPTSGKPGPLRPFAYAAGGVGVAGIVGFAVLGAMGKSAESDLEGRGCKPNCPQSEVDSIKTKLVLADVSLGVGIAGLGAGVALFFLSQPKHDAPSSDDSARLHLDVHTTPSLAYATVTGRF